MTTHNVGLVDAIARGLLATLTISAMTAVVVSNPSPVAAALWAVVVIAGALLLKSAVEGECPVHEKADIDTTRRGS